MEGPLSEYLLGSMPASAGPGDAIKAQSLPLLPLA